MITKKIKGSLDRTRNYGFRIYGQQKSKSNKNVTDSFSMVHGKYYLKS